MDETSDCEMLMAIENCMDNLNISSTVEDEDAIRKENEELSLQLVIIQESDIPAIHDIPYTNRSMFKAPFNNNK